MTAAAFAKGLLALEGELTPILVQMVKSANTNGLLDNDCDSSKYHTLNRVKTKLHEMFQKDREFTLDDEEFLNPCNKISIANALSLIGNPVGCCRTVHNLIKDLNKLIPRLQEKNGAKSVLYHNETWDLMLRRWGKLEKDFLAKSGVFDISKVPDIYDCIKYDLKHNRSVLAHSDAWTVCVELYTNSKNLADVVIPQEYGMTKTEKLTIAQGICTPLLKKIKADLQRNVETPLAEEEEDTVNRLNPNYSSGVSSPGRHVRTRLYFTSESHIHSLLTVLSHGGLVDSNDEQWRRAMEYVSLVSELNYMTQIVIMLYEDPTKESTSEERFHVELHFSPGVNCCVQKDLPPGPGFRPHSRNNEQTCSHSSKLKVAGSQMSSFNTSLESNGTAESEDNTEMRQQLQQNNLPQEFVCSYACSDKQVTGMFSTSPAVKVEQVGGLGGRKRAPLPPFPEADELSEPCCPGPSCGGLANSDPQLGHSGTNCSTSDPIPIKKHAPDTESSETLSIGSVNNASRSYEEVRPRSLETDVNISGMEKDSPLRVVASLDSTDPSFASRSQSMEDVDEDLKRNHRLSLPGQKMTNYLNFLQELALKQASGTASQLFSTAVISGASSVPNLGDPISQEVGEDGSSTIRPLETLHNALSLKQLDGFLDHITTTNFKTPSGSPGRLNGSPEKSTTTIANNSSTNQLLTSLSPVTPPSGDPF